MKTLGMNARLNMKRVELPEVMTIDFKRPNFADNLGLPTAENAITLELPVMFTPGTLPPGLLTPGREPTLYDVLTVKGTSRTSVLFAILSVTLISSRYCPSGNDASGTACPLCN